MINLRDWQHFNDLSLEITSNLHRNDRDSSKLKQIIEEMRIVKYTSIKMRPVSPNSNVNAAQVLLPDSSYVIRRNATGLNKDFDLKTTAGNLREMTIKEENLVILSGQGMQLMFSISNGRVGL